MLLADFVRQVREFDALPPKDKIKVFGWYLHVHKAMASFDNEAIGTCFKQLHLTSPDVSVYLPRMAAAKPPELLKERSRYRLARGVRSELDKKYGVHQSVIQVRDFLLRSMVILPEFRSQGFGREMTEATIARTPSSADIYLATTTAAAFFEPMGFEVVTRNRVPEPILSTRQLSGLCPESATIMRLNRPPT